MYTARVQAQAQRLLLRNEICFEVEQIPYIYQGLSGSIVRLEPLGASIIALLQHKNGQTIAEIMEQMKKEYSEEEIQESLQELLDLEVLQGEEQLGPNSFTPPIPQAEHLPVQTLVFHLVNECNLNCTYCYAGAGEYGQPLKTMNQETAQQALDFLFAESGNSSKVSVVLFGGEPLLNWALVKFVVEYGQEKAQQTNKEIEFSLTTNGTLLNEQRIRFLAEHRVGITVSMDGPAEVHDKWRPFANGAGSYQLVRRNVEQLLQLHHTRPVATRVTLTKEFSSIAEIMQHLLSLGFHEVGFAPVSTTDEDILLGNPELFRLLDEFATCADLFVEEALENRYLGFSNLVNILVELHLGVNKGYACGAGLGFMAVSPSGDLFLCHRFNEDEEYKLGNIFTGIDRTVQQQVLNGVHVDNKTTCSKCALKHTCSGGCYFEAKERMGEITSPNLHYCRWMKHWYTIGLKTYVRLMEKNPAFLERICGFVTTCQQT